MSLNAATAIGPENRLTAKRVKSISRKYIFEFKCCITNVVSTSLLPFPGIHRQWQSDAYGQHGMNLYCCVIIMIILPRASINGLYTISQGYYDYRPYVKKVTNNRQIMYECDRGFKLDDDGPPGATCVAGRWSPKQLPRCVAEQHSRGRWARSIKSGRAPVGASIRQGSKKITGKGTRRKRPGRLGDIEDDEHGKLHF